MKTEVDLELYEDGNNVIMNIIFLETGEIRQKVRSKDWLLKRLFRSELFTYKKNFDELIRIVDLEMRSED